MRSEWSGIVFLLVTTRVFLGKESVQAVAGKTNSVILLRRMWKWREDEWMDGVCARCKTQFLG